MNKSLLPMAMLFGGCAALMACGVEAMPIHSFNLSQANGKQSYTYSWTHGDPVNESLTLSGWEFDNNVWTPATMIYKDTQGNPGETGLGVKCNNKPSGNSCGENEIGTTPWQMIDVNLSGLSGYKSITVGAASVNTDNSSSGQETAYLYGTTCTPPGGSVSCTPVLLDSYTYNGKVDTVSWTFDLSKLASYNNLWLTPNAWGTTPDNNGNVLLWGGPNGDGFSVSTVPEPGALGIFGFGILLVGLLGGLARRRH